MADLESGASERRPEALVIDDERNIRATLGLCLESLGLRVTAVASGASALAAIGRTRFTIAFLDLRLGTESGLDLIAALLARQADLSIVVITAYATIETAVEAIRRGARDYLPKPFTPAQVRHIVEQDAERRALTTRVAELEGRIADSAPDALLDSRAPAMARVVETLTRAAAAEASVLLRGESGTGKSVLARVLHGRSPRASRPFVVVNCPTLSEELLASELFGHVRGAFTGATRDQAGKAEAAEGGTLFLDEIAELSTGLQAKLLRFLQDREFERVGETRTRRADVRVVAATNRDLEAEVRAGRFREDLLYRINVVEIAVPALRERSEDVLPLAARFLEFFARAARRRPLELAPAVRESFLSYAWPGNVRELRNVVERIAILWPAPVVELAALPERMHPTASPRPRIGGDFTLEAIEREHLEQVLARAGSKEEAARILGIDASTLWRRKRRYEEG